MKKIVFLLVITFLGTTQSFGIIRYVTPTGSGTFDGTSWANAQSGNNLQATINASGTGDEVWVADGVYYTTSTSNRDISFSMKNEVTIYGSFSGTEALLSERDLSSGLGSILSGEIGGAGSADNAYKVISNSNLLNTAIIDGFIIEAANDNRSPTNAGNGLGGGIYNHGYGAGAICHPIIRNCLIRNNFASWGAGAFNNGYAGGNAEPTYINCIFYQNHAYIEAGGMDSYGVGGNASPTLFNCIFDSNTSATNVGAMYCWGGNTNGNANPILENCVFVNNSAQNGYCGAIISSNLDENGISSSGTSNVTLKNCILWNNSASGSAPQFYIRGSGASIVATHSNIDLTGQTSPHVISGAGTGNIHTDPLFLNINLGQGMDGNWMTQDDGLQLQNTSPCINSGNNSGVNTTDILLNSRIFNTTVDMGAYEFSSTSTFNLDAEKNLNSNIHLSPNPTKNLQNLIFTTGAASNMEITLYAINGQFIKSIFNGPLSAGQNNVLIDLTQELQGIYFLGLKTDNEYYIQKVIRTE